MDRVAVSTAKRKRIPFTFVPIPRTFFGWIKELEDKELRLYLAVANRTMGCNARAAKIPMTELSAMTGWHRSTISRYVKKLVHRGLLRASGAKKSVTEYEILMPPMPRNDVAS